MGSDQRRIMPVLLALVATILTSFLPILNKRIPDHRLGLAISG